MGGVAFLLFNQQPRVPFPAFPKIYFDVAEIYQLRWLEESEQWLENVDRTHPVLANSSSGKLVVQKHLVAGLHFQNITNDKQWLMILR